MPNAKKKRASKQVYISTSQPMLDGFGLDKPRTYREEARKKYLKIAQKKKKSKKEIGREPTQLPQAQH